MPEADLPLWLDVLLIVGAGATALVAVLTAAARVTHLTQRVTDHFATAFAARVQQDVDKQSIADDVEARLAEPLGRMLAEVRPNGGSSMRDAVNRIERLLDAHTRVSAADRRRLWDAYGVLAHHLDVDPSTRPSDECRDDEDPTD